MQSARVTVRVRAAAGAALLVLAAAAGVGCGSTGGAGTGGGSDDSGALDGAPDGTVDGTVSGDASDGGTFFHDSTVADAAGGDATSDGPGAVDASEAGSTDAPTGGGCVAPVSLALAPANQVSAVTAGTAYSLPYTVTATYANATTADVTAQSFFTISDPNVGSFTGNTFSWGMVYGGVFTVSTLQCGVVGTTQLTLQVGVVLGAGGGDAGVDAGGLANGFGGPPSTVTACAPTLVYPPDGVLLPPNTNVIEVHFLEGTPANNTFEISFTNAVTDVKIYTTCTGTTPADGMPLNGGCIVELTQAEWDYIAKTNRNGAPLTVKVRAVGCDGSNVASSATRQISFAEQDMVGVLYYWASMRAIVVAGQTVNSGGVFRYDFGVRGQLPDPVLTPTSPQNPTGLCIGCHTISRDGRQMIFDFDDNDDDDEYGDVRTDVYDIAAAKPLQPIVKNGNNVFPPGYHTWDRTTQQFLLSDGPGNTSTPAGAFRRVSALAATLGYAQAGTLRGTTPDWSPDNASVVFAAPPNTKTNPPTAGFWQNGNDLWFAGASLYVSPWNGASNTLGAATQLVASAAGDNYYYPSYSPDGSFIAFNHATSGANFHNVNARVQLVVAGQANPTPDDMATLNTAIAVTNSWARWAPFVQAYKQGKILWLTFSSTRDYGLRIQNTGKVNCYPTESPLTPTFNNTANCSRTQLWMAAVDLDTASVAAGKDVSWPAFWLPFQDITTNNHLAQWAQQSFTGTCTMPDAGVPEGGAADASADGGVCAASLCCENGGCTACPQPPPPPPPSCSANSNCAPGECCPAGTCVACPNDGGAPEAGVDAGVPEAAPPPQCNTCLDCNGQACNGGSCGSCQSNSDCCAPLLCKGGTCVPPAQ